METRPEVTTSGPTRWTRMAGFGLLMQATAPLLFLIAGLIWGLSEGAPFFLVTAAVPMIGAFLVLRFSHTLWAKIVGIVFALAAGFTLFWTAFGLTAPGSFFDFVPGLLVIPGMIIAITGCVAAIVAASRGKAPQAPAEGEKKTVRAAVAIIAGLAVVSAVFTFVGKETVDDSEADQVVTLNDFEFDKDSYSFDGGTTVLVRNDDPFTHTFTVEELDIDEAVTPGSEILVEIPDETGDFELICEPHEDQDMVADLSVE